jgi:hypothetical protein
VNIHVRVATCVADTWIEAGAPGDPASSADVVRIQAEDLREAQRATARLRADALVDGREIAVFLDVETYTAVDARTARSELSSFCSDKPTSIRYIGTEPGLFGLISDIVAAGVADGATIIRLVPSDDAMRGTG